MRFNLLFGMLAVSLLCSPCAAQDKGAAAAAGTAAGNWRLVGPTKPMQEVEGGDVGRINTFVFHPSQPNTIYAATPAGGLWRTQDDGATWVLLSNQPDVGIQDIAIDPLAPDTMYMLTGDGDGSLGAAAELGLSPPSIGVLKSVDGGQTWNKTGLTFDPAKPDQLVYGYRLAIDPTNPAILIAATTKGVWRTSDGGQRWSAVKAGLFWDAQFHPTDPSIVYAASTEAHSGTCSMEVYRSTDAGQTWTALRGGLPSTDDCSGNARVRLAVTPAKPDTLYVLYGSNTGFTIGLYRSDDRGNTFTKRSSTDPLPKDPNAPPPINLTKPNIFGHQDNDFYTQSFYTIAMAVSPTDADLVHVGAVDTWGSEDGGRTWKRTSLWSPPGPVNYVHADIHMLAYHGGSLYAATDGGIYRSTNPDAHSTTNTPGVTWKSITRMETGITIAQIYHVCSSPQQPDVLYYGAQDNGTYRLDINGQIFQVYGGDGFVCQVDPQNSNTLYVSYAEGDILRTDDAAHACECAGLWKRITPTMGNFYALGPWLTPYILGPADPNDSAYGYSIYACYTDLWYSSDHGESWKNLTHGALGNSRECRQVAVSPSDPKTIYVAKEAEIDLKHRPGAGDARTPLLGGGGVFRSTDGGATWQSVNGTGERALPLAEAAVTDLAVSPTDARRVWVTFQGYKADVKVFGTTDGGATWTNLSSGLPNNSAHAIAAENGTTNGVYVGTDDGVYYRDDTLGSWLAFKDGLPNAKDGRPLAVTSLLIQEAQHRLLAATFSRGVWVSDLHK